MPIRPETDELIAFLNSLVESDSHAIAELLCVRVPCNHVLADHPSVQVSADDCVGMLGILNGFCGTIDTGDRRGWGPITAVYEDSKLKRFERTNCHENRPPADLRRGEETPRDV